MIRNSPRRIIQCERITVLWTILGMPIFYNIRNLNIKWEKFYTSLTISGSQWIVETKALCALFLFSTSFFHDRKTKREINSRFFSTMNASVCTPLFCNSDFISAISICISCTVSELQFFANLRIFLKGIDVHHVNIVMILSTLNYLLFYR